MPNELKKPVLVKRESSLYPGEYWVVTQIDDCEFEISCTYLPLGRWLHSRNGSLTRCFELIQQAEADRKKEMELEDHFQAKWDRY